MRTKNILLSAIFLLLAGAMPSNAQAIEESNHFKKHFELGGDVIITDLSNETVGNESHAVFNITAPSAGDYYMNFWLLPAKYEDNTYTIFKVLVNGSNVGNIIPDKGNWQSIGLPENKMVALQKGENTIALVTTVPEIPQVEFVRLSKASHKAQISSAAFDSYLAKAKNREMGISTLSVEEEDTGIEPELEEAVAALSASPEFRLFTNVPIKYSIRTSYQFTAGQDIFITTNSATKHVLDFYISTGYGDPQYLSWLNVSEPSLSSPVRYLATIRATIPITGTYFVKVRSFDSGVSGTVNINVNGQYSLTNSPIYYAGKNVVIPADGKSYAAFTMSTDSDPYLFIEGAGSIPGKIVAYGDDCASTIQNEYGIRSYDSYINKTYSMPVKAVHVSSYGSSNPESKCHVAVQTLPTNSYAAAPRKSNGTNGTDGVTGIGGVSEIVTNIYPNPVGLSSVLNIDANEEINRVEIYDISGRLIQSKKISSSSIQIPVSDLNIGKKGIYIIKLVGTSSSKTQRLLVK